VIFGKKELIYYARLRLLFINITTMIGVIASRIVDAAGQKPAANFLA
jgi:hypothetical protein